MKKTLLAATAALFISSPAFAVVECIDQSFLPEAPEHSWVEGSNYCWVQDTLGDLAAVAAFAAETDAAAAMEAAADSSVYIEGGTYDGAKLHQRWTALLNAVAGIDPDAFNDASTNLHSPVYDMSDADFNALIAEAEAVVDDHNGGKSEDNNSPAWVAPEETDGSDNSVKDTSDPVVVDDRTDGDFGGDTPPSGIYDNIRDWIAYETPRNTQLGEELRDGLVSFHRINEHDWLITGTNWTGVWQFGLGFTQD